MQESIMKSLDANVRAEEQGNVEGDLKRVTQLSDLTQDEWLRLFKAAEERIEKSIILKGTPKAIFKQLLQKVVDFAIPQTGLGLDQPTLIFLMDAIKTHELDECYSTIKNKTGFCLLHFFLSIHSHSKVVLARAAKISGNKHNDALVQAVHSIDIEQIESLLKEGANVNATATRVLLFALEYAWRAPRFYPVVKFLLEHGADPNITTKSKKHPTPALWVAHRDVRCLMMLLEHGADPNTKYSSEPALWSVLRGLSFEGFEDPEAKKFELIKLLVDKGADVNAKDDEGNSVLYFVLGFWPLSVAKLLLEKGAQINANMLDNEAEVLLKVLLPDNCRSWFRMNFFNNLPAEQKLEVFKDLQTIFLDKQIENKESAIVQLLNKKGLYNYARLVGLMWHHKGNDISAMPSEVARNIAKFTLK